MPINASSIYTGRIIRQDSPFRSILDQGKRHVFAKGQKLFMDKTFDDIFFYLDKGCATLFHDLSSGKSVPIIKFYEGNTFATSVSVVSDFTNFRTYNVHYSFDEDTVAWCFSRKYITDRKLISKYPEVIAYVLRQQCIKTLIMHNNFTMRNEDSAEKMICNFMLNMSLDNASSTLFNPKISQTELAASLGIHRTTLSRALKKLRDRMIIGDFTPTKIEILDMDMLKFIATS